MDEEALVGHVDNLLAVSLFEGLLDWHADTRMVTLSYANPWMGKHALGRLTTSSPLGSLMAYLMGTLMVTLGFFTLMAGGAWVRKHALGTPMST